jgi:hypothetical protein
MPWAVLWRSENALDGKREFLIGEFRSPIRKMLFNTRAEAREHIRDQYGYISKRPDLQAEPHGWRMPIAVKVEVEVRRVA